MYYNYQTSSNNKCIIIAVLLLLLLGVCFYIINDAGPIRCDDLIYQYFWLNTDQFICQPIDLSNRIDNFFEAFKSQINHYQVMNGRFIVHLIIQCFCGFLGKPLFNVFNTVVYLLFLWGCIKLTKADSPSKIIFVTSFLWLFLPIQYIFSYSISFAVNYLWVSTLYVYYILFIGKYLDKLEDLPLFNSISLCLLSAIVASMHEGFSLPMAGAMFFYLLPRYKKLPQQCFWIFIGFSLGTILVAFSPSTIQRGTNSLAEGSLIEFLYKRLEILRYSKRLLILLIVGLVLWLRKKQEFQSFCVKRLLIIYFIILDFLMVLAIPHYSQRREFPLELFSLLLIIELLMKSNYLVQKKPISIILAVMALSHAILTTHYATFVGNEYTNILMQYQQSPQGTVYYQNNRIPKPFNSYVHRLEDPIELQYISYTMDKEINIITK